MVIDHRTYNVKPGKLHDFLKVYEAEGFPLQKKYLGHCVGWYFSNDIGALNQVVHMWAYQDLSDREERRNRLAADPAWGQYLAKATGYLDSMENKILRPTPFFTVPEVKG